MVKFYSDTSKLSYNWNQVAIAFWQKYPNPHRSVSRWKRARIGKLYNMLLFYVMMIILLLCVMPEDPSCVLCMVT